MKTVHILAIITIFVCVYLFQPININFDFTTIYFNVPTSDNKHEKEASVKIAPICTCHKDLIEIESSKNDYFVKSLESSDSLYYKISKETIASSKCDSYHNLKKGLHQKIISVSLDNYNDKTRKWLRDLSNFASNMLHGWNIRVYHNFSIKTIPCDLECDQVVLKNQNLYFCNIQDILNVNETVLNNPFSWKWILFTDKFVDFFMTINFNELYSNEQVNAIYSWTNSNYLFNIMRVEPTYAIQDGLWGYANKKNPFLSEKLFSELVNCLKTTADANSILYDVLWGNAKANASFYDNFYCKQFGTFPFPTNVPEKYFCGISCFNCCKIISKNSSTLNICRDGCTADEVVSWEDCTNS